jgi:hypothetical protein
MMVVVANLHPSAETDVKIKVREIAFKTDAGKLLEPIDVAQLIVAGVSDLDLHGSNFIVNGTGPTKTTASLHLSGKRSASCFFYHVRSSAIGLTGPSLVSLAWPGQSSPITFTLKAHGTLTGSVTSEPAQGSISSAFSCDRVDMGSEELSDVSIVLSKLGGDTITFSTQPDARIDFSTTTGARFVDTQVPVLGSLRFSTVEPGPDAEEKAVILAPSPGEINKVSFPALDKSIDVNENDLLVIDPDRGFYMRSFSLNNGIYLQFRGRIRNIKVGAGTNDLRSQMPSLFDHLDKSGKVMATVPSLVVLLLGILEKMGLLPGK